MRRTVDVPAAALSATVSSTTSPLGSRHMGSTAVHMHPETYLWLIEQDRERAMTKRALERAAREGGQQHPGHDRGGISGLVRAIRQSAATTIHLRSAGPGRNARLSGPSGA